MKKFIDEVYKQLVLVSSQENRNAGERYFKEEVKLIGVRAKDVRAVSKIAYQPIKTKTKDEIFEICDALWQTGYMELGFLAADWAYNCRRKFIPEDFEIFENWVNKYVSNWASCDSFCNHTMGDFVVMYPEFVHRLKKWAKSDNRWVRRASAVSLIIPARKGKFQNDIFDIADILLLDKDDMVQKGYGWMLKSASQFDTRAVFKYVLNNKNVMPRTALRYAIEKMPDDMRKEAMKK
ncbi:MAG TPA: DNA alkylation repair protein [Bacteroidales bacterium]|nr:DNA alkylation repair protein [Bacteroidales bacterium]